MTASYFLSITIRYYQFLLFILVMSAEPDKVQRWEYLPRTNSTHQKDIKSFRTLQGLAWEEREVLKKSATCALGIAILSGLCQSPQLAASDHMTSKVPIFIKVKIQFLSEGFCDFIQEYARK